MKTSASMGCYWNSSNKECLAWNSGERHSISVKVCMVEGTRLDDSVTFGGTNNELTNRLKVAETAT